VIQANADDILSSPHSTLLGTNLIDVPAGNDLLPQPVSPNPIKTPAYAPGTGPSSQPTIGLTGGPNNPPTLKGANVPGLLSLQNFLHSQGKNAQWTVFLIVLIAVLLIAFSQKG
jgi:hypothetical protein